MSNKRKTYKSKIKIFCATNDTIKKVKLQPTEWEKTFVSHISDKHIESKIYKELLEFNDKRANNPILKCAKFLDRCFFKEDVQIKNAQHHYSLEKCKSRPKYDTTSHSLRWLVKETNSLDVEKLEPL